MGDGLIPKPYLYVEINNKDVSVYITPYLINFEYIDNDGLDRQESDDVQIELEDSQGFFRENPPARGSSLKIKFGYEDRIRNAGMFFIDSYTYKASRSGDTFTIKALAKDVKSSFREIKTVAFENTTLKTIAQQLASRHGYQLDFAGPDLFFKRITQQEKTDLKFLADLCNLYGYICKVVNKRIVIRHLEERLSSKVVYVLTRENIIDFEFEVSSLYEAVVDVVYLDPHKKDLIQDKKKSTVKASGSAKKINTRVESKEQAEKISTAQSLLNSLKEYRVRITSIGIPDIHAGGQIEVRGFGKIDGVYYLNKVVHKITREGYITGMEGIKGGKK